MLIIYLLLNTLDTKLIIASKQRTIKKTISKQIKTQQQQQNNDKLKNCLSWY